VSRIAGNKSVSLKQRLAELRATIQNALPWISALADKPKSARLQ